jgi:Sec-independent protein secretion pathway component TatC
MWIFIGYAIVSFLIIYIAHQIWMYVVQKYSKKKYLASSQMDKYKSIIRELQENTNTNDLQEDLEDFLQNVIQESQV